MPATDPEFRDAISQESACRTLYLAVIQQAILDLAATDNQLTVNSYDMSAERRAAKANAARSDCEHFLFDVHGAWAAHRQFVCEMAGVSERDVQNTARKALAEAAAGKSTATRGCGATKTRPVVSQAGRNKPGSVERAA